MFVPPIPADDATAKEKEQDGTAAPLAATVAAAATPAQPTAHAPSPAQQAADAAASSSSDDDSDGDEDDGEGEEDIFGESVMGQLADSLRAALQARAGGREASPSPPPDRVRKRDQLGGPEALRWQPEVKVPEQKQPVRVHPGAGADKEKGLAKQVRGRAVPAKTERVLTGRLTAFARQLSLCMGECRMPGEPLKRWAAVASARRRDWCEAALLAWPSLTTGVLNHGARQPQRQLPTTAGTTPTTGVSSRHFNTATWHDIVAYRPAFYAPTRMSSLQFSRATPAPYYGRTRWAVAIHHVLRTPP